MKRLKRMFYVLLIITAMMVPVLTPITSPTVTVQAASIRINKTKLTIEVGSTNSLKITGTSKKVTWTSSDKDVVKVSSKGKITAVNTGKATVTATVADMKLTCKVTVIDASSSATKKK